MEEPSLERVQKMHEGFGVGRDTSRALAVFGKAEYDLIKSALIQLESKYPRLEPALRDFPIKFLLPIHSDAEFYATKIPHLEIMLTQARRFLGYATHLAEQNPQHKDITAPYVKIGEEKAQKWERIIEEAKSKIPQHVDFIGRVFEGIENRVRSRLIITPDEYEIRDIVVRNQIYKAALGSRDNSWLLGFDLELITRIALLTTQQHEQSAKIYKSLEEAEKNLIDKHEFTVIFPSPLGADQVSGKQLYEQVLPNLDSTEEYEELEKIIREHFEKRREQVFQ